MKKKFLSVLVCGALSFGASAVAQDFSKASNDELAKLHGSLKNVSDAADLKLEIKKRVESMEGAAKKEFLSKVKQGYEKNTENMSVKEFREYEASVKKEVKDKMQKLGMKFKDPHSHCTIQDSKAESKGESKGESKADSKKDSKGSKHEHKH